MSRVKGPPTENLRRFNNRLADLPRVLAVEAARRAAPIISRYARASFDSGKTAYDSPRPLGSHGNMLSLVQSGATRAALQFTSDGGSKIRAVLGTRYAKFLIGKFKILPIGNAAMPMRWRLALNTLVAEIIGRAVGVEPAQLRRAA
jgi:hypothetical protein